MTRGQKILSQRARRNKTHASKRKYTSRDTNIEYTNTHACTRKRTSTDTQQHIHTHKYACTHTQAHQNKINKNIHAHPNTPHAHVNILAQIHARMYTRRHKTARAHASAQRREAFGLNWRIENTTPFLPIKHIHTQSHITLPFLLTKHIHTHTQPHITLPFLLTKLSALLRVPTTAAAKLLLLLLLLLLQVLRVAGRRWRLLLVVNNSKLNIKEQREKSEIHTI